MNWIQEGCAYKQESCPLTSQQSKRKDKRSMDNIGSNWGTTNLSHQSPILWGNTGFNYRLYFADYLQESHSKRVSVWCPTVAACCGCCMDNRRPLSSTSSVNTSTVQQQNLGDHLGPNTSAHMPTIIPVSIRWYSGTPNHHCTSRTFRCKTGIFIGAFVQVEMVCLGDCLKEAKHLLGLKIWTWPFRGNRKGATVVPGGVGIHQVNVLIGGAPNS